MSATDISKKLGAQHSLDPAFVKRLLLDAFAEIESAANAHGRCQIRGFGTFKVRRCAPRPARNLVAGTTVLLPERHKLVFEHACDRKDLIRPAADNPEGVC